MMICINLNMAAWWLCSPQLGLATLDIILNIGLYLKQIIITAMAIVKSKFTYTSKELDKSVMSNLYL